MAVVRLHGYCERCHRVKLVRVSGHGLATMAATRGVPTGVCDACEETADALAHGIRGHRGIVVQASAIRACPTHRLEVGHYREDGTCRCRRAA